VTEDVHAVLRQLRSTRRAQHAVLHHLPSQRVAVVLAQHVGAPQMPMIAEGGRESDRERHVAFRLKQDRVTAVLFLEEEGPHERSGAAR